MTSSTKKFSHSNENEELQVRRGPWTLEEDTLLTHYIARNGEGRWNMVAKCAGLKRTGKSCRLRWLNYLKPDIKRGNLSPQEQVLILELHSKWGNRWSKIAQYLPGRTDNEIKNYWRTRVQKQARQLNIESNSDKFFDAVRSFWMPRLQEQMKQNSSSSSSSTSSLTDMKNNSDTTDYGSVLLSSESHNNNISVQPINNFPENYGFNNMDFSNSMPDFMTLPQLMDLSSDQNTTSSVYFNVGAQCVNEEDYYRGVGQEGYMASMGNFDISPTEYHVEDGNWAYEDVTLDPTWNLDDIWQLSNSGRDDGTSLITLGPLPANNFR